jgi:hypothetical protein
MSSTIEDQTLFACCEPQLSAVLQLLDANDDLKITS